MNVLADENFPRLAVEALRAAGHSVLWARTDMGGAADDLILARAQAEGRLVVTFDKDFGELAYHWGLSATCGIALFRLHTQDPDYVLARVIDAFVDAAGWIGHFAVVRIPGSASGRFRDCSFATLTPLFVRWRRPLRAAHRRA